MSRTKSHGLKIVALAGLLFAIGRAPAMRADEPPTFPAEDVAFFEKNIRPVLVKHCYGCHSEAAAKEKKLKGGLRVDSREGLLRGGDSGPAIVPERSDDSLLLQALRYESLEMPPQGKLPTHVIADFERWISRGAADPRSGPSQEAPRPGIDLEEGRRHWAYRPIAPPEIPLISVASASARSPVDAMVQARLHGERNAPTREADRTTLLRRVSFDLVGLPPTPDEIDDFLSDAHPDALERLVDRLLASPHFGPRWGRHWLSVVRFGESMTLRGFIFPEAWRYRDYVIETFNADRPFDRFLVEQVAGDLLDGGSLEERQRSLIATTFLTLGNVNLEEQDKQQLRMDVVDEQLEAISKAFLAQTIGCARCHDHKFDPIPMRDYYALAGILANVQTLEHANVSKWIELPLPVEPEREAVYQRHEAALAELRQQISRVQQEQQRLLGTMVVAVKDLPGVVVDDRQAKLVGDWETSQSVKPYIGDGYLHDRNTGQGSKTATLIPELPKAGRYEVRLAYTPADNRSDKVTVTVFSADGETEVTVNQKQRPPIDGLFVSLGQYRFELNGQGYVLASNAGANGHVVVDAVQFLPMDAVETAAAPVTGDAANSNEQDKDKSAADLAAELKRLQQELKELEAAGPKRPKYMSVKEDAAIGDIRIHIRGSVHSLGETAPRGFLQVATFGDARLPPTSQSGRRELGEWIAGPENPLTARVFANRAWHWLFGAGLSRTPDNFGTTGEPPTHPELLDYLAVRLRERNWSVKSLIREIVQSHTYRQSSEATLEEAAADPENRRLARQNRRRLDAECLLDAVLTISGRRNDELGGNTIRPGTTDDYSYRHDSLRRAAYWPVLRNSLPELFEVFDFADPSVPTGVRNASTTAAQALFWLNDAWIRTETEYAAKRLLAEPVPNDAARIRLAFRGTLGRDPTERETQLAEETLAGDAPREVRWARLIHALMASIDFRTLE
jgi:hypothetical protein